MNGVYVGNTRITRRALNKGDVIRIGPFEIRYNGASIGVRDIRGALRIDAHGVGDPVGRLCSLDRCGSCKLRPLVKSAFFSLCEKKMNPGIGLQQRRAFVPAEDLHDRRFTLEQAARVVDAVGCT